MYAQMMDIHTHIIDTHAAHTHARIDAHTRAHRRANDGITDRHIMDRETRTYPNTHEPRPSEHGTKYKEANNSTREQTNKHASTRAHGTSKPAPNTSKPAPKTSKQASKQEGGREEAEGRQRKADYERGQTRPVAPGWGAQKLVHACSERIEHKREGKQGS